MPLIVNRRPTTTKIVVGFEKRIDGSLSPRLATLHPETAPVEIPQEIVDKCLKPHLECGFLEIVQGGTSIPRADMNPSEGPLPKFTSEHIVPDLLQEIYTSEEAEKRQRRKKR